MLLDWNRGLTGPINTNRDSPWDIANALYQEFKSNGKTVAFGLSMIMHPFFYETFGGRYAFYALIRNNNIQIKDNGFVINGISLDLITVIKGIANSRIDNLMMLMAIDSIIKINNCVPVEISETPLYAKYLKLESLSERFPPKEH